MFLTLPFAQERAKRDRQHKGIDVMLKYDGSQMDIDKSVKRQDLIWKSALILVCAGLFALMLLSDAHDTATRCTGTDPVAQEACLRQLRAEDGQPPAKGPYPLVVRTTGQPGH
jgi:hypothetical protein